MQVFAVKVRQDDTVEVVAAEVVKVTPRFYIREEVEWRDPRSSAFPYDKRIAKNAAHLTARSALEAYMAKRQRDKASAQSVVGQATKQIASANEALMRLPVESSDAVDDMSSEDVGAGRAL